MKSIHIYILAATFIVLGLLLMTATPSKTAAFSGSSSCDLQAGKTLAPGYPITCSYDVYYLQPYLDSTTPSGKVMNVGYCTPGCTYLAVTAGHYGSAFEASQDTSVASFYQNPFGSGYTFTAVHGIDYWTFN